MQAKSIGCAAFVFPFLLCACGAGDDDSYEPMDFYAICCNDRCDDFNTIGDVRHNVPTWHENEYGLGLEGEYVVLTTSNESAGYDGYQYEGSQPDCYQVTVAADKDPQATLKLEIDVLGDGENILVKNVPADDWSPARFEYRAPADDGAMKFSLVKQGAARAVLYFIEIDGIYGCSADAVVVVP